VTLRPSLLLLTAGAAGLSAVANAIGVAAPAPEKPIATRLGTSIQEDMTARDRAAAQRARALDLREQAARAAEQRLKQAQAAPATPAGGGSGRAAEAEADSEDARFDELARIYQAMKPKPAALVFEQLAMDVQVEVAQRMRERATAAILAAMSPKGAAALSMAIARRQMGAAPTAIAAAPPPPAR
jgi:flagellar motility protein MotE (MotC chaperone)